MSDRVPRRPLLVVFVLALGVISCASAAEKQAASPPATQSETAKRANVIEDLVFHEVSLTNVVDFLRNKGAIQIIIVREPGADDPDKILLRNISLRNIEAGQFLGLLGQLVPNVSVGIDNDIYIVRVIGRPKDPQEQEPRVHAFRLSEAIQNLSLKDRNWATEELLTLLESAVKQADESYPAKLQFHPTAELLVMTGTMRQLEIVHTVLGRLNAPIPREPQPAAAEAKPTSPQPATQPAR